jgi:hypothetical protein
LKGTWKARIRGEFVEVGEVGWVDDLVLEDGEADLHLVQP